MIRMVPLRYTSGFFINNGRMADRHIRIGCVFFVIFTSVCENTLLKNYLPSAKKSKSPSHQVFGVFALEVNKILQATPSKFRREMGMCATTIYVQQQQ